VKIVDVPPVGNLKKNPAKIRQAAQGSGLVKTRQAILDLLLILSMMFSIYIKWPQVCKKIKN